MVVRVRGATHDPKVLYALIFRLSRPYSRFPHAADDSDGPVPLPPGAVGALGNFALSDYRFAYPDNEVANFDPPRSNPDNCFFGVITSDDRPDHADVLRHLNALPVGARVRVALHPLEYRRDGKPKFGHRYVRHPRLQATSVDPRENGLSLRVRSRAVVDQLTRMGCASRLLY
jgi:hypothetical protein